MAKRIAIIAGAGPGTGSAVAHRFALSYPVVLLGRTPSKLDPTVRSIQSAGGTALAIPTDLSSSASVTQMVETVKKEFGQDVTAAAGVFNASGGFVRKEFLETSEEEWVGGWEGGVKAAVLFARGLLPLLAPTSSSSSSSAAEAPSSSDKDDENAHPPTAHPPTLIFTGATASVKSGALFSLFAATKHAIRSLASSLAKEYGPKGVHVAHAVIDAVIDTPGTKAWNLPEGSKLKTEDIADAYWWLHTQRSTGFTWEVDLRPGVEKW